LQGQRPVPMVGSEFRFVPGSWGRYRLVGRDHPEGSEMWFAVLDEVKQRKGRAYWIEIETFTNSRSAVVTRLLVPDTGAGPGEAQKAYVQIAGYRPFEVPRKYLRPDPKKGQEQVGQFARYDVVGTPAETNIPWAGRTLRAVTVQARDGQGALTTVVASRDAPPLCVVKLDAPGAEMELLDWGAGARTRIVGKPVGMWRWVWGVAVQAAKEREASPK